MYRVLFADDESSIRRGIKCLLDWESMGFSTDYEAENGQEALDIIKKYNPDLILLDIRMMSKLDLVKVQIANIHCIIEKAVAAKSLQSCPTL